MVFVIGNGGLVVSDCVGELVGPVPRDDQDGGLDELVEFIPGTGLLMDCPPGPPA